MKAGRESEVTRVLVSGTVLGWTHRRSQEWRDQHKQKIKSEVHASAKLCLRVSARLCEKTRLFGNS